MISCVNGASEHVADGAEVIVDRSVFKTRVDIYICLNIYLVRARRVNVKGNLRIVGYVRIMARARYLSTIKYSRSSIY
jgi:hypothetical protein